VITTSARTVHCEDALSWLEKFSPQGKSSFVASLPDISEFPSYQLSDWKRWFIETAKLIMMKTPPEGVAVFFQSDIKWEGTWVDKAHLIQKAAEEIGHELLWHKIFCRAPVGTTTFGRPAYSHLLCFSKDFRLDPSRSSPDVWGDLGEKTWQRGMGLEASLFVADFIKNVVGSDTLINPFCGEGSVLAAGEAKGLQTIGIERSPKRAQKARTLRVSENQKFFLEEGPASRG
jgi:hypothetical protein